MTGQRLAALYREYGPVIYWRCAKLLRDEVAAEDATQRGRLRSRSPGCTCRSRRGRSVLSRIVWRKTRHRAAARVSS